MQLGIVALVAATIGSSSGFVLSPTRRSWGTLSSTEGDFAPSTFAAEQAKNEYDRVGFPKDKVAIGVDPVEVLQWLGTRDDLIERFLSDNSKFDQERAETEVDKFMMDAEMVGAFIKYEKKKSDPKYLRTVAEETLSDPGTWKIYAVWITGGAGFAIVKNKYVEPKFASGEWQEIKINLGDLFHFGGKEAVEQAALTSVQDHHHLLSHLFS